MSKKTKFWLITAISLILIGCTTLAAVMFILKWDFSKLSSFKYETNNYQLNESFDNISINTDTAKILFVPSQDEKTSIVCYEDTKVKHLIEVEKNTLSIKVVDTRKWYEYIGINFGSPKITVSLPEKKYGEMFIKASTGGVEIPGDFKFDSIDITESTGNVTNHASVTESIKIKTSTGNIYVENISAKNIFLSASTGKITASKLNCNGDLSLKVSTGKTFLKDIGCNNLTSTGSTGKISLENVNVSGKFLVIRSTGDVLITNCDANEIYLETDTGNVKGNFLTDKVFITETNTGNINVPKTTSGGKCEIKTDTGNINFK